MGTLVWMLLPPPPLLPKGEAERETGSTATDPATVTANRGRPVVDAPRRDPGRPTGATAQSPATVTDAGGERRGALVPPERRDPGRPSTRGTTLSPAPTRGLEKLRTNLRSSLCLRRSDRRFTLVPRENKNHLHPPETASHELNSFFNEKCALFWKCYVK